MMEHAIWLASIFGPFLVIVGLWMLFYHDNMVKIWASVKNTPAIFHCGAVTNLFLGLVVIAMYNVWSLNLAFLVTLFGWLMIVRGILALFVPQIIMNLLGNAQAMKYWAFIGLIWGILLSWFAFWM